MVSLPSSLLLALVTFKVDEIDQESETQEASLPLNTRALWKDHSKGVGSGATLLLEPSPNFADLWGGGIVVRASHHLVILVMEVEGNVNKALATAAITRNATATTTGFRLHQVYLLPIFVVGELRHKAT